VRSTSTLNTGAVRDCWMRASATPGTAADRLEQLVGVGEIRARSAPRTCRSIGAGAPKFRIWLTMSAGRNEKVVPGNARGSSLAQLAHVVGGRPVIRRA
jgi:hypothetical protein